MNSLLKWGLIAVGAYLGYEYLIAPAVAAAATPATTTTTSTPGTTTTGVYGGQATVPAGYMATPTNQVLNSVLRTNRIGLQGYRRGPSPWLNR